MTVTAIDLFAGAGGFSTGAEMAGIKVLWAANHWDLSVKYHKLNHPEVVHACQDLEQADWRQVPKCDIILASPACQGHSKARGKEMPHHDPLRQTAWAVVSAAEYLRPKALLVENVEEFVTKWNLFPAWKLAMEALGYSVSPHFIDAADHGVPQNRVRAFVVCVQSKHPLNLVFDPLPHVAVNTVIEWDNYDWSDIECRQGRPRAPATLARIKAGRKVFGDRFVCPFYGTGSGETGRSIHRPIGTLTTKDRWLLVDGDRCRMLQVMEQKLIQSFPADYILPSVKHIATHMIGNAVAPRAVSRVLNQLMEHI